MNIIFPIIKQKFNNGVYFFVFLWYNNAKYQFLKGIEMSIEIDEQKEYIKKIAEENFNKKMKILL